MNPPAIDDPEVFRDCVSAFEDHDVAWSEVFGRYGHEEAREGGEAAPYDDWTVDELQDRAAEIGIEGRSSMDKAALIEALREH